METLESVQITHDVTLNAFRLPVQFVNRPNLDFRGFCGTVASGEIRTGDTITALPSGKTAVVKSVLTAAGEEDKAFVGQAITVTLDREIDISRGDMIVRANDTLPNVSQAFDAHIVWMNDNPLVPGKEYAFKLGGKTVFGRVEKILHRVEINTLDHTGCRATGPERNRPVPRGGQCSRGVRCLSHLPWHRQPDRD
jgi:sulfate adenylyltransferase subunit 1